MDTGRTALYGRFVMTRGARLAVEPLDIALVSGISFLGKGVLLESLSVEIRTRFGRSVLWHSFFDLVGAFSSGWGRLSHEVGSVSLESRPL